VKGSKIEKTHIFNHDLLFTDVSSLYSLLSLSLKSAPTEYFDSHDDERVLTLRFLEDVAVVCSCSQIDLLKARLHLILDLPISFVKYLMGHLTLPLKKIFSATLPLALVEKGDERKIKISPRFKSSLSFF